MNCSASQNYFLKHVLKPIHINTMIKTILKLEGLAMFLLCLYFYHRINGSWVMFFTLLLLPDISMIGYLKNERIGAMLYNLFHNYVIALLALAFGLWQNNTTILSLGIILAAHISVDRFFEFGLKYPTGFKHTHLHKDAD